VVFYAYGAWFLAIDRQLLVWNDLTSVVAASASLFLASAIAGVCVRCVLVGLSAFAYANFDKGLIKFNKNVHRNSKNSGKLNSEERTLVNNYQHIQPRQQPIDGDEDNGITVDDVISATKYRKAEAEDSQ